MKTEHGLTVEPLTGSIGAVVTGLDLRPPIDDAVAAQLRTLLLDHLVLILPNQHLSDDEHVRLADVFGTPNINPISVARGITHPLEWIEDTADSPPKADLWHTDVAYSPSPPDAAILANLVAPPYGGDTMWVNLYDAHDQLSTPMQEIVASLSQDVEPGEVFREAIRTQFGEGLYDLVKDMYRGVQQPLVRVHPETGRRALYLCGAYHRGIVDMKATESAALMSVLRATLHEPGIQCRWRWSEGDVAIWDERCTNHRGLGDHHPMRRMVRRCTVGGDQPFGPNDEQSREQLDPASRNQYQPTEEKDMRQQ